MYCLLDWWLLLWKAGYASGIGGDWSQCLSMHYVIQSPFSISITIRNCLRRRKICHHVSAAIRNGRPIRLSASMKCCSYHIIIDSTLLEPKLLFNIKSDIKRETKSHVLLLLLFLCTQMFRIFAISGYRTWNEVSKLSSECCFSNFGGLDSVRPPGLYAILTVGGACCVLIIQWGFPRIIS